MSGYTIEQFVTDLDDSIVRALPDATVGSVLSRIESTHEPAFVFNNGTLSGLVSPAYSIFKKKHHYLSKVKSCLFIPPKIYPDTPLYEVAEHMLITHLYTLPVYHKNKNEISVVHARTILEGLRKNKELFNDVKNHVAVRKPVIHSYKATINEIYRKLRDKKIARMILVDTDGKLKGIISRRDIQRAFTAETPRQRFGRRLQKLMYASYYDEEKKKREDAPISQYYSRSVQTAPSSASKLTLLKTMLNGGKHSTVITNRNKPVGFISRHDFLNALTFLRPKVGIRIIVPDPKDELTAGEKLLIMRQLTALGFKLEKRMKIDRIEMNFNTVKNAVGQINEYELKLIVIPVKGPKIIAESTRWDLERGVHELIDDIESQL